MLTLFLLLAQTPSILTQAPGLHEAGLHDAIVHHNLPAAEALIHAGADPNARDIHARTPLHDAVIADFPEEKVEVEIIRLLLARGADPNTRDDSGASPLDEAVWRGSMEKAALLLDAGAEINQPELKTGATPLNEAVFRGHIRIVELLLERGADASIKDRAGYSPVENAVRRHYPEVARVLLAHSEDRDLPNRLLEEAVRRSQLDTVLMLLDSGAAIEKRSAWGSTALYDATLKGDNAIVSLLVSRGADVNTRETTSGTTPLYAAAAFGREEAAVTLLLWGADPSLASTEGISPLQAAESNGYSRIAGQIRSFGKRYKTPTERAKPSP